MSEPSILELQHGLHFDVAEAVYHARVPGLVSKHVLDIILDETPAHYKAWLDGKDEEASEALAFGKAFHCAILEPERFATDYVIEPVFGDCRKKENKANRDAWREANKGAVWLPGDDHRAIVGMTTSVRRHSRAGRLLADGRSEVTARWRDRVTGLEGKARGDHYADKFATLLDVKTTERASRSAFERAIATYGYHRQCALYTEGFAAAGAPVEHFVFVAVEKKLPYAVAVYELDEAARAEGADNIREAMQTLADCIERDEFGAYDEAIHVLSLPAWAFRRKTAA